MNYSHRLNVQNDTIAIFNEGKYTNRKGKVVKITQSIGGREVFRRTFWKEYYER